MPSSTAKTTAREACDASRPMCSTSPGLTRAGACRDSALVRAARLVTNGATPKLKGLVKISSEDGSRMNCTLTYPLPSKSRGTRMRCTEAVVSALNHWAAYTWSRSMVMRPAPVYGALMLSAMSSPGA